VWPPDKPLPKCDARFTWSNYDSPDALMERVTYFYNGNSVGEGRAGFEKVIDNLRNLPMHSTVLVYPYYEMHIESSMAVRVYPFFNYWRLLDKVALERDLKIIFPRSLKGG
jgi:hypothetical protein